VWYELEPVDETILIGVDEGTDGPNEEEVREAADDLERDAGTGIAEETNPEDAELEGELTTSEEHRDPPEAVSDEPNQTEVVESTEGVQNIPRNLCIGAAVGALAVGVFLWWRGRRREPTQQALTESETRSDTQPESTDQRSEDDTNPSPGLIEN
jgi:hypothetical protein